MTAKLLLINAIENKRPVEAFHPPLGLGYLASAIRDRFGQHHFEFKVADRDIENNIVAFKPDIVAISSVSSNFNHAMAYARVAKRYGLPVIIGGVHISALPSSLTDDMDVGIIGEGEQTIIELLKIFEKESRLDPDSMDEVQGIVYKRDGALITTLRRPPIIPLDKIPIPARDLLTFTNISMLTSRGCPYRCIFCSASCFWGGIRYFSPEYVVKELIHILDTYQVPNHFITIWDELFIADTERLRQIADLMERKGLPDKLRFWCHARANLVTDEVANLLSRIGVRLVSMGFESGSPSILQYYKGPTVSLSDHENAIAILRRHQITPNASFIIGAPKETREDFLQTIRFLKKHQIRPELYLLTPYPGTPLWDYAVKRGLVSELMDWTILKTEKIQEKDRSKTDLENCWNNAVILSETLTRKEIFDLYQLFEREWRRIVMKKNVEWALRHPLRTFHVFPRSIFTRFFGKKK